MAIRGPDRNHKTKIQASALAKLSFSRIGRGVCRVGFASLEKAIKFFTIFRQHSCKPNSIADCSVASDNLSGPRVKSSRQPEA